MKKYIFIFLLFTSASASSQSFKPDDDTISSFNDVPAYLLDTVANTSLTKDQLFSNALNFISSNYKDSRSIIESKDADRGEIVFKSTASTNYYYYDVKNKKGKILTTSDETVLFFTTRIFLKDNKFKIVLTQLRRSPTSNIQDEKLALTLRLDNQPGRMYYSNEPARRLALTILNDMAGFISKKPLSDF